MRKRILNVAVAGTLGAGAALGIAACGGDDNNDIAPVEIDNSTSTVAPTPTNGGVTAGTTTDDKGRATGGVEPGGSNSGSGGGGYGY
jgi:hypothetical protein